MLFDAFDVPNVCVCVGVSMSCGYSIENDSIFLFLSLKPILIARDAHIVILCVMLCRYSRNADCQALTYRNTHNHTIEHTNTRHELIIQFILIYLLIYYQSERCVLTSHEINLEMNGAEFQLSTCWLWSCFWFRTTSFLIVLFLSLCVRERVRFFFSVCQNICWIDALL